MALPENTAAQLRVLDTMGKQVLLAAMHGSVCHLDVSQLSGVYTVVLSAACGSWSQKLVVQ